MSQTKFMYKVIRSPEHPKANNRGYIYEHVFIAEQILGRKLTDDEVVHHIDHNRKNNSPDNLMIFASDADHTLYHKGYQAWSTDGLIWHTAKNSTYKQCKECGRIYTKYSSLIEHSEYCCEKCLRQAQNRQTTEKIKIIQELLYKHNGNFSEVARILNTSSSGLAKLLKKHGYKNHSHDYKNI